MPSQYDWQWINPLDQTNSIAALANGNQQINAGLRDIGGAVGGIADVYKQRNTDEILNALAKAQTTQDLPNAMNAVQALQQQYGRGYDQTQVRNAIDTRGATLAERDLQALNLQRQQAYQAAIPELNKIAIAQAKANGIDTTNLQALADAGYDATQFIDGQAKTSIDKLISDRNYAANRADTSWDHNFKISEAARNQDNVNADNRRADLLATGQLAPMFASDGTNEVSVDSKRNFITTTTGGVSKGDAFQALASSIFGVESSGNRYAQNPRSSASGLGQFTDSSWVGMMRQTRPDLAQGKSDAQLVALKTNPQLQREMTVNYAKQNANVLTKQGVAVNPTSLYLSHFLDGPRAANVLKANPNDPISKYVTPAQIKANPEVLGGGKTVGQVIQWANRTINKGGGNASTAKAANAAVGPGIAYSDLAKFKSDYAQEISKLTSNFNTTVSKDKANTNPAIAGKGLDSWVNGYKKESSNWFGASTNPFNTTPADIAAMVKENPAAAKLPAAAQINIAENAWQYVANSGKLERVPNKDLKTMINNQAQGYTKNQTAQYQQAKAAAFDKYYQAITSRYQAAGSPAPSRSAVMQMLDGIAPKANTTPKVQAKPKAQAKTPVQNKIPSMLRAPTTTDLSSFDSVIKKYG